MERKVVSGIMLTLLLISMLTLAFNIQVLTHASPDSDWLDGWSYRKSHVIYGAFGAGADYQIKIRVHYGSGTDDGQVVYLNYNSRTDFGDVRFTDDDGITELDYWMQEKVESYYAIFWVEVMDDLSLSSQTIYIYYGNSSLSTTSNGTNTFIFFDDFSGPSFDTDKWELLQGDVGIANSSLEITGTTGTRGSIRTNQTFSPGVALHSKAKGSDANQVTQRWHHMNVGSGQNISSLEVYGWHYDNQIRYTTRNSDVNLEQTVVTIPDFTTWNMFETRWTTGKAKYLVDEEVKATHTNYVPTTDLHIKFTEGKVDCGTVYTDWIFLRKFTDPEPAHARAESLSLKWQVDIAGAFPGPLLVDDVDGDGVQEIIGFSNMGKDGNDTWHGYVFTLDPSSRQITWQSQDLGAVQWHNVWHKLRVVDLDGDGDKEIVVCVWRQGYPSGGFWSGFVYVFDGKTHALLWKSPNIGGRNMDLAIADLDDDGIKEIIAGGNLHYAPPSNGRVYVFDGANFTLKWETGSIGEPMAIIVDDLDSDGDKEVLVGTMFSDSSRYYVGYLHVFNGTNGVLEWKSADMGNVVSLVVDDVDMDGIKEVIAGTSYQRWYEDTGHIHIFDGETKGQEWKSPTMKYVRPIDICDVDDDGIKEIIAGTTEYHQNVYNGHLHVFDGVTHEQELDATIGNVYCLAVDDVDNDGTKEIITTSSFRKEPYTGYLRVFDGKNKTLEWISENINSCMHAWRTSIALADLDEQGSIETIVMGATEHTCVLYVFSHAPPARVRVYVDQPLGYIPGVSVGDSFTVDMVIEVSNITDFSSEGIVGWGLSLAVDPDVLNITGAIGAASGYFLWEFADSWSEPYPIQLSNINATAGLADVTEQIIPSPLGGAGDPWSGLKLVTLVFTSKSETAHSLIDLVNVEYMTPDGMWHPVDEIMDGYYNPPPAPDLSIEGIVLPYISMVPLIYPTPDPEFAYKINATVTNEGTADAGSFNVSFSVYLNETEVPEYGRKKPISGLAQGASETVWFDFSPENYGNYTLIIEADCDNVVVELDETNNAKMAWVIGTIGGDMDGDGDVDWVDFGTFATFYGSKFEEPQYYPADIDYDGDVDWYDFGIFAQNFGQTV